MSQNHTVRRYFGILYLQPLSSVETPSRPFSKCPVDHSAPSATLLSWQSGRTLAGTAILCSAVWWPLSLIYTHCMPIAVLPINCDHCERLQIFPNIQWVNVAPPWKPLLQIGHSLWRSKVIVGFLWWLQGLSLSTRKIGILEIILVLPSFSFFLFMPVFCTNAQKTSWY